MAIKKKKRGKKGQNRDVKSESEDGFETTSDISDEEQLMQAAIAESMKSI